MKAVVLKPHKYADKKTKKKGDAPAYFVRYKRTDGSRNNFRQITLVKSGRRVHFSEEQDTDALVPEFANIALGIKTAARAFQDAIDGKIVMLDRVGTFGAGGGTFALQRIGQRIAFVAPCGAKGYLTMNEAKKLVGVLHSL